MAAIVIGRIDPAALAEGDYPDIAMAQEHQRCRAPRPFLIVLSLRLEICVQQFHQVADLLVLQGRLQLLGGLLQRRFRVVPAAAGQGH